MQLSKTATISEYQSFIWDVYGQVDNRHFNTDDVLVNIQRFLMRGIKGIRKGNEEKTVKNLIVSMSWFMALMNQYQVNIEESVWRRFPYLCSYCGNIPCSCKKNKVQQRQEIVIDDSKHPKNLKEFQEMFDKIYPSTARTLEHAGIHLAEEIGELSEAVLAFKGTHSEEDFNNIVLESSDLVSCFMGVFNSLEIDLADRLSIHYSENCNKCKQLPCACTFSDIMAFQV